MVDCLIFQLDANLSALLEIEQSYADLYNERKVTKSAASVATCELKDVLSNQMVLSAISPTRQNSLRRNVTAAREFCLIMFAFFLRK